MIPNNFNSYNLYGQGLIGSTLCKEVVFFVRRGVVFSFGLGHYYLSSRLLVY